MLRNTLTRYATVLERKVVKPSTSVPFAVGTTVADAAARPTETDRAPRPQTSPAQPSPATASTSTSATAGFKFHPLKSWDTVCQSVQHVHMEAEATTREKNDLPDFLKLSAPLCLSQQLVSSIFRDLKITRHLRYEGASEVRDAKTNGLVFASEEATNTYTFNVSNVASYRDLAVAIASIPPPLRRLHSVFGIDGAPCDFFCDLDWKKDVVSNPEKLLSLVINTVLGELTRLGIDGAKTAIFDSPHQLKWSYHVHFSSPTACLFDYTHARSLAYRVNELCQAKLLEMGESMKEPLLDTAIYRNCGQMRMAHQAKGSNPTSFLSLYRPVDKDLADHCASVASSSIPEQIEMTFCIRKVSEGLKIVKVPSNSVDREKDGRKIRYEMRESKKANRFEEVLKAIRNMPPEFAREYRTWNNIGCALFSFGPEYWDRGLDAWLAFSRMAGDNFDPQACRKRWYGSFKGGSRGTALELNWRRGYTYILFTIWGRRLPPVATAPTDAAAAAVMAKKKKPFNKK